MNYFHIASVSLATGIVMTAAGLDMHWPGTILIVAGLLPLGFRARQAARRKKSAEPNYRSLMAATIAAPPPPVQRGSSSLIGQQRACGLD
jgi:hypothetical protein